MNARTPNNPPTIATIRHPTRSHKDEVIGQNKNIKPRPMEKTHAETEVKSG